MVIKTNLEIEDFKAMELLESYCYSKNYIANDEDLHKWYKVYPYTTVAAYSDEELVGFINYFPIKKELFDAFKNGESKDSKISLNDIVDINEEGNFYMFLCRIVVAPFFQERGFATYLVEQAIAQYKDKEDRCVEVISDSATIDGENLSKRFGLDFCCNTQHGTKVFWAKYKDFKKTVK